MVYKDLPRRPRDKHVPRPATRQGENHRLSRDSFTELVKSPTEILATTKGKTMLWPPPKMFTPTNKMDRTKYYEFHERPQSWIQWTCIRSQKRDRTCIVERAGMAHLANGAKIHNSQLETINRQGPWVSHKRDHPEEGSDTEGIEHVTINDAYPEQTLHIAANLPKMLKEKLREFLCHNKDIFAWKPADITGIP
ncbi:hypothetical protein Tco_1376303 [Tanacetum coccineum]